MILTNGKNRETKIIRYLKKHHTVFFLTQLLCLLFWFSLCKKLYLPINGTASDVEGIFSATKLRKTVSESNIVTPSLFNKHIIMNIIKVEDREV